MVRLSVVYGQSQLLGSGTSPQLWQPRLNTPFIYQFFNCKKGIIVQRPFSSTRQFGTFSLWRKLRWASTPQRIRATFHSKRFYDRTTLWEVIQHLGSNSLKRFQMEKRIRSHEFGLHGCYFIRKLASNLGEPQRSYALNAIDRAIKFWKGKRVPRCLPLRAPWILSPTWSSDLRKLLRQHIAQMRPYTVTSLHPLQWFSPRTLRSKTACAITRNMPLAGPTGKPQCAFAPL